jgi:signal transduction histidine kinase
MCGFHRPTTIAAYVLLVCAVAAGSGTRAQAPTRATRILLIYGLATQSPSAPAFIERFRATVREDLPKPVEIYEEYLDFERFPGPLPGAQQAQYLSDKYKDEPPHLIVAIGAPALSFSIDRMRVVMPDVPIVFGLTYAHVLSSMRLPPNVTGRTVSITLGATLLMARRLQPDADSVVVIAGSSGIDSIAMADAFADAAHWRDSIRIVRWQGFPYDSLLGALRRLSPRTIVYFAHFRRDGLGRTMVPLDIIPEMVRASAAPMYAFVDLVVGTGIVGGAVWTHGDEAARTALLAGRVLRRAPDAPFPAVETSRKTFMVDARALSRWKMNADRLPPNTEVRFRMPTVWERFRWVILTTLGLIVFQSVLMTVLMVERRQRIRAQRSVSEQTEFEKLIAKLTADAAHHASEGTHRALKNALARVARFAGADEAELVLVPDGPSRDAVHLRWTRGGHGEARHAPDGEGIARGDAQQLELPLTVAGTRVGMLQLVRSRGAETWPPTMAVRLCGAADVIAGAIERSRTARHAEETQRQVAHLGRLAMMGELASTIAHELRQPLAAIRINATMGRELLDRPRLDLGLLREICDDVVADAARAADVIDHIRSLVRKENPESTVVHLNVICREAAALLQRDAERRAIHLDFCLDPELPPVAGHPIELQQVVLNLVLNALDAAAISNGVRRVSVETVALDTHAELVVRDSGAGMSAESQEHVFESFFTTKAHGTGMGLVIVRSITERHGGNVQVENAEQGGAVFRVRLPALADRAVPAGYAEISTLKSTPERRQTAR